MSFEIEFWELNPHCKTLNSNDNSSDLLHNVVLETPFSWYNPLENSRAKDDPVDDREWWLAKVKMISNEKRE